MVRLLLLLVAAALGVASFYVPVHTAGGDGGVTLEGYWVAMLGVAVLAPAVAWPHGWRRAGFLTSALVLAVSAQLTVTQPLWLQTLEIRVWKLQESPLLVAAWSIVLLQWLSVARWALARHAQLRSGAAPFLTRRRLVVPGASCSPAARRT